MDSKYSTIGELISKYHKAIDDQVDSNKKKMDEQASLKKKRITYITNYMFDNMDLLPNFDISEDFEYMYGKLELMMTTLDKKFFPNNRQDYSHEFNLCLSLKLLEHPRYGELSPDYNGNGQEIKDSYKLTKSGMKVVDGWRVIHGQNTFAQHKEYFDNLLKTTKSF